MHFRKLTPYTLNGAYAISMHDSLNPCFFIRKSQLGKIGIPPSCPKTYEDVFECSEGSYVHISYSRHTLNKMKIKRKSRRSRRFIQEIRAMYDEINDGDTEPCASYDVMSNIEALRSYNK